MTHELSIGFLIFALNPDIPLIPCFLQLYSQCCIFAFALSDARCSVLIFLCSLLVSLFFNVYRCLLIFALYSLLSSRCLHCVLINTVGSHQIRLPVCRLSYDALGLLLFLLCFLLLFLPIAFPRYWFSSEVGWCTCLRCLLGTVYSSFLVAAS